MKENFKRAVEFTLGWEGEKYTEDPNDPGGATKYGISQRSYKHINIKNLTRENAITIYKTDYWDRCDCDNFSYPLDMIIFDTAVNLGCAEALKLKESVDKYYTENIEARNMYWQDYLFLRLEKYAKIGNTKFLKGWLNRVLGLHKNIKFFDSNKIKKED